MNTSRIQLSHPNNKSSVIAPLVEVIVTVVFAVTVRGGMALLTDNTVPCIAIAFPAAHRFVNRGCPSRYNSSVAKESHATKNPYLNEHRCVESQWWSECSPRWTWVFQQSP